MESEITKVGVGALGIKSLLRAFCTETTALCSRIHKKLNKLVSLNTLISCHSVLIPKTCNMHDAIVCKHFLGCKPFPNIHTPLSIAGEYFLFQEKSEKARLTREESYRVLKEKRTTEILSQFQKTKALWEKKAAEDGKKIERAWEQQGISIQYKSCMCLNVLFTFCELVVVFFVKVKH